MDFPQFSTTLLRALSTKDISCYIDILSSQDVLALKAKNAQTVQTNSQAEQNKIPGKANKRYLILTYMTNENKYHYPLSLAVCALDLELPQLKAIYV